MNFNFTYAPGTSLEQMIGLEMAGRLWASYLADDVTINLHIETTSELPSDVIGGALLGVQANQSYETWRSKLASDRTTANDQFVHQNQQNDVDKFTALVDGFKLDNNQKLNVSRANAKALNMRDAQASTLDGVILMNTLTNQPVKWDYDAVNSSVPSGSIDFFSVAVHEIGHTLGFYSGIDKAGWLTQKTQYDDDDQSDFYATLNGALDNATGLDMFRFTEASVQAAGTSDSWIDLSIGGKPYFSLDGGKTSSGAFATGENTELGGDGDQASHWNHHAGLQGIMDPTIKSGEARTITALDQQMMDAIGWDLKADGGANLATLQAEVKESLAKRLGITVAALEASPTAVQQLTRDRTQDAESMIAESEIYNWRSSSSSSPTRWWQNGQWQNFLSEKIDLAAFDSPPPAETEKADLLVINFLRENDLTEDWDDTDFFLQADNEITLGEEVKPTNTAQDDYFQSGWDNPQPHQSDELMSSGSNENFYPAIQGLDNKIRDFAAKHNLVNVDQIVDYLTPMIADTLDCNSPFHAANLNLIPDTSSSF